jgi:hypothetical protein
MATLDELSMIDGVVASDEFKLDGSLVDYRSSMEMSPELPAQAAQFCATLVDGIPDARASVRESVRDAVDARAGVGIQRRAVCGRDRRGQDEGRLQRDREGRLQRAVPPPSRGVLGRSPPGGPGSSSAAAKHSTPCRN